MRHTHHAILGAALIISTQMIGLEQARANCAMFGYRSEVDSETNSVTICADDHTCSMDGMMLRQNVDTGEVVELPAVCGEDFYDHCYVDECLPAGTYRYGLATPLPCGCGTRYFFEEITIEEELDENCEVSDPNLVALPYTDELPWGSESSEDCAMGCSVAPSQTDVVFPTYGLIALIGLSLIARRWFTGR